MNPNPWNKRPSPPATAGSRYGSGEAKKKPVTFEPLELAMRVIRKADREHPADSVLRKVFVEAGREAAAQGGSSGLRAASSEAARMVFSYYRWLQWLDAAAPVAKRIQAAVQFADRFKENPASIPDAELEAKSLPEWANAEVDTSPALLRALQSEPKLWLRSKPGRKLQLWDFRVLGEGPLSSTLEYFGVHDLFQTPEFHSGAFQIQDVSSQAVGMICAPVAGQTWWDACAGEGGKTLHLSDLMENKGLIWASDRSAERLRRLKARAGKAKVFNYRAEEWDGSARLPTKTRFDGILVDAPCSGMGTWHRNPHARWTTQLEDVRELAKLQLQLLSNAAKGLKPGGKLVYSVCTLSKAESDGVADAFEKQFPSLRPMVVANPLDSGKAPAGRHWFLPQDLGGNGMFVAVWTLA